MLEVDRDLTPRFQPEACSALVGAEAEQRVRRDDVAPAGAAPRDALQLAQLLERVNADVRVGADADPDPALAQLLHRREAVAKVGLGRLPEALDPPAPVRGVEQDKPDAGFLGCLERSKALVEPEVVEFPDRRVAGAELLAIDVDVVLADLARGQTPSHVQHGLAPRPEIAALGPAAQGPLEPVAMGVHEPREREPLGHLRILSPWPLALCQPRWQRFRTSSRSAA